jgi:hypothetical protein
MWNELDNKAKQEAVLEMIRWSNKQASKNITIERRSITDILGDYYRMLDTLNQRN